MQINTTRRGVLCGVGLAAVGTAIPAAAAVVSDPSDRSAEFASLLSEAEQADAVLTYHNQHVYLPAHARAKAAITALPHTSVDAGPSMGGGRVIWSTAKPSTVGVARSIVEMAAEGKDMQGAGLRFARTLTAAQCRRERAISRISRDTGCTEAANRSDALSEACSAAQSAVAAYPVSSAADLAAKLAFMVKHQMGDGMDWLEELHADARRVAKLGDAA